MQRPTHFLALPLHIHSTLRSRVGNLQQSLFDPQGNALVRGLDRSIVIDPRRLHLTLGVMRLGDENKTVNDALQLLESLRPEIHGVLGEKKSVKVKLDHIQALKTKKNGDEVDAHVLYLGVKEPDEDTAQLKSVCDIVHKTFQAAGYITERRPLKLHCTILNTSHRKNKGIAFSYSDILKLNIGTNIGEYDVGRVELWVMGSHGANNEYKNAGGIDV